MKLPICKVALSQMKQINYSGLQFPLTIMYNLSVNSSIIASVSYFWLWHRNTICAVYMSQSLIMIVIIYCHRFYNSFTCTKNISNNPVCSYIFKTTNMIMIVIKVFAIYTCKQNLVTIAIRGRIVSPLIGATLFTVACN